MKRLISIAIIATLALMISLPLNAFSQEKKVKLKTVKIVDGKKVVNDTTFTVKEGDDHDEIVKTLSWFSEEDSAGIVTIDLDVDTDIFTDKGNKVVIIRNVKDGDTIISHGDKKFNYFFKSDDHKGGEYVFHIDNDFDFEFDEGALEELRAKLQDEKCKMHDLRIMLDDKKLVMLKELDDEKILVLNELEELKELKELQNYMDIAEFEKLHHLKELKNIEIDIPEIPEIAFFQNHNEFIVDNYHSHDMVNDKELREAGIKNKADKLEVKNYNLDINNGVVGLDFSIVGEGTPKVTVFNYFGDKVFSGKPELIDGKYAIRIDLSSKQNGVYYLQVTLKNSSFTKKLRLR